MVPVMLCGGSGMRLWPLSRKNNPKQFVPLNSKESLLRRTIERLASVAKAIDGSLLFVAAGDRSRRPEGCRPGQ